MINEFKIGDNVIQIRNEFGPTLLDRNKIYIIEYIHEYIGHIKLKGIDERLYSYNLFSNDTKKIRRLKLEKLNEQRI